MRGQRRHQQRRSSPQPDDAEPQGPVSLAAQLRERDVGVVIVEELRRCRDEWAVALGGVMTSLSTSTIGAPPITAWTICVDETEPMSIDPALSCRAQHADEPMTISSTCRLFAV
jgi:hypothetical protein